MENNLDMIDMETVAGNMAESWNQAVHTPYLALYYNAVGKIPEYYNWEEWRQSEERIYKNMYLQIQSHFNTSGSRNNAMYEFLNEEFKSEREKLLQARERCLEKKSCGLI